MWVKDKVVEGYLDHSKSLNTLFGVSGHEFTFPTILSVDTTKVFDKKFTIMTFLSEERLYS